MIVKFGCLLALFARSPSAIPLDEADCQFIGSPWIIDFISSNTDWGEKCNLQTGSKILKKISDF